MSPTTWTVDAARWDIHAEGSLAWLRENRQLLSVHLRDFRLRFGD